MTLEELNKSINEIITLKEFDPTRFKLITSMHQRTENTQHKPNKILIKKIQQRIDEYKRDYEQGQNKAKVALAVIQSDIPEYADQAKNLLDKNAFEQLENRLEQITFSNKRQETLSKLKGLKDDMSDVEAIQEATEAPLSLDEMLFNQEQKARIDTGSTPLPSNSNDVKFELQSMKNFRASMKYFNIDKIITRAINDYPENAGPHNPHMLAIKSLMHMRDLSPQYLRRFASYIETILWLEKNSTKLNRKKTP